MKPSAQGYPRTGGPSRRGARIPSRRSAGLANAGRGRHSRCDDAVGISLEGCDVRDWREKVQTILDEHVKRGVVGVSLAIAVPGGKIEHLTSGLSNRFK